VTSIDAPPWTTREATDDELDAAGAVVCAAYAADGHASAEYHRVLADARARAKEATVVVAVTAAGQVVGSVTFALAGSPWADVATDGEAEFRMLGGALSRWCIDRARASGRRRIVISSQPEMTSAHRMYLALGFVRRPDLDWSPVPGVDLLGFSLEL